ncbi:intermembrane phospholipid transport protein YdbH family protein [Desulfogranum japonicum]|uniref:intermembrane phospholipid transport protein YdbH family protein n=1 Tax=Desulfogranum japonicum TaxID=231447 RepID=UPI000429DA60|nr:YdbH domain-containing protein [Desulfogranum japonicum]
MPLYVNRATPHNLEMHLETVSLNHLLLRNLKLSVTTDKGPINVKAENVSAIYSPDTLKQKSIHELHIGTLQISLPSTPQEPQSRDTFTHSSIPQLVEKILEVLGTNFPVQRIRIDQLSIHGLPYTEVTQQLITFQLHDSQVQRKIEIGAGLKNAGRFKCTIRAPAKKTKEIEVIATLAAPGIQEQTAYLNLTPAALKAEAHISLQDITPFLTLTSQESVKGSLDFQGQATWDNSLDFSMGCAIRNMSIHQNTLSSFTVTAEGKYEESEKLILFPGSHMEAGSMQSESSSFDGLQIGLAGEYYWQEQDWSLAFAPDMQWKINNIKTKETNIAHVVMQPRQFSMSRKARDIVKFEAILDTVSGKGLDLKSISIPEITIHPKNPLQLTVEQAKWMLAPLGIQLSPLTIHHNKTRASLKQAELTINLLEQSGKNLAYEIRSRVADAKVQFSEYAIPFRTVETEIASSKDIVTGTILLNTGGPEDLITLHLQHNMHTGKGHINGTTTHSFQGSNSLQKLIKGKQIPFDLTGGQAACTFSTVWGVGDTPETTVELNIKNGAGSILGFPYTGLNAEEKFQFGKILRTPEPGTLSIEQLHMLVPLEQVQVTTVIDNREQSALPAVIFQEVSAKTLGGKIQAAPFTLSLTEKSNDTTLYFNDINLASLISYFKAQGLEVEGTVSGHLPVQQTSEGFVVNEGEVHGIGNQGVIRYQPPDTGQQSKYTEMVLRALQEFYYTLLQATVTYHPDGNLLVEIQLQGKSPHLSETRPVHLNIHTEQNLLSLLRSVQYNNKVTSDLDKELQHSLKAGSHKQRETERK